MAKQFNAANLATKWEQNTARSGPAYKLGVQGVTTAPGQLAAAAQDKYERGVIAAVRDGTFARNVGAVGLQEWKDKTISKGADRLASGAAAGKSKMQAYLSEAAPVYQSIMDEARTMNNDGSTEAQLAIMRMTIEKMKTLKGRRR